MKNFVRRVGLSNAILVITWAGLLAYDLVDRRSITFIVMDLVFLALTVFVGAATYHKSASTGCEIETFEQGETDVLVNLSKGVEPLPTPGEGHPVECTYCRDLGGPSS